MAALTDEDGFALLDEDGRRLTDGIGDASLGHVAGGRALLTRETPTATLTVTED
jgi:hypothetical protein